MEVNPNLSAKAHYDYKLVKKALDGDQQAFGELLERYEESIYYMLLKMVNNAEDAADLSIEAFGKAFKKIHQYTPDYAFSTWLFKIATNNCIDFIRKKKLKMSSSASDSNIEFENFLEELPSMTLDPEEKIINNQKNDLVRDIVKKLNIRYRKLVELRYFDELSYEEIAAELDIPIGTVKAQLFRARELLFNILKSRQNRI